MLTAEEAIRAAFELRQAGRLSDAEGICRQVLGINPRHADALHLMGLIAIQTGNSEAAVRHITAAIQLDGERPPYHLSLAEAYRGLGRAADARACYEQALRLEPNLFEAQNSLGMLLQECGDLSGAIACFLRAVATQPNDAGALCNLGVGLYLQGDFGAAVDCFRRAVTAAPSDAKAHYNLGLGLDAQGRLDEARGVLEKMHALVPDQFDTHCALGSIFERQRHWDASAAHYRRALELQPRCVQALNGLGLFFQAQGDPAKAAQYFQEALANDAGCAVAHYNLGTALEQLGKLEDAASAYEAAIRLRGDMAIALDNLGNIRKAQGRALDAIRCYERALGADPNHAVALNNLGSLLQEQGQLIEAMDCFRRALRLRPDFAEAYSNLGVVLQEQGDHAKSLVCYDKSLRLRSDLPEAHNNRALILLSQENFAEGWAEFEWRQRMPKYPRRLFEQPTWTGEPLAGRTLLVHAEQGLGDTLMFVRYLPEVRQRGGRVFFEAQAALVPLLRASGVPDVLCPGEPLPRFDLHVPLMSLPRLVHPTLHELPGSTAYLKADPQLVERWRPRIALPGTFNIGVTWQGNREYAFDRSRSIALSEFAPLARVAGVRLVSLQVGRGTEQLGEVSRTFEIEALAGLDEQAGAFMDTAAVMKNLDLVITSDTATAHLAGALGVKAWVAISKCPDWRWLLERDDCPWYSSMRLFRQRQAGDWTELLTRMAGELAALVQAKGIQSS